MAAPALNGAPIDGPELDRLACEVRQQLSPGLAFTERVPLAKLRKSVRIEGLCGAFDVRARGHAGLPMHVYAVTLFDMGAQLAWIWLHRFAWAELPRDVERTRFSVGHELGMIALFATELDGLDVRAEPEHYAQIKRAARLFAGHLLVPDQALKRLPEADEQQLMARFGVGLVTAQRRLAEWKGQLMSGG